MDIRSLLSGARKPLGRMRRRLQNTLTDLRGYRRVTRAYGKGGEPSAIRSLLRPRLRILFHPSIPDEAHGYVVYKLCALLGYRMLAGTKHRADIAFKWDDATVTAPALLALVPPGLPIINGGCTDISKRTVDAVSARVMNYTIAVDPLNHIGPAVEKGDMNAAHDGRIIMCPITQQEVKAGAVYQRLIDDSAPDGMFIEYRCPVYGGMIPLVYRKYRSAETRFLKNHHVELLEPSEAFSDDELAKIVRVAAEVGGDCVELDVLRDIDGRIYVIDVNNTPNGPPKGLPEPEKARALSILAPAFEALLKVQADAV